MEPGVFPMDIGDIIRHIFTKCVMLVIGATEIEAHSNLNLCAHLEEGIETYVHEIMEKYSKD